ncbi:hypothetical protein DFH07DRAFT_970697 [Mycena maculata]|uniref:Uncharacterized protein n=1 Tax=Mycena maculata TaxID=230809 RepID=A0AAD7MNT2_9AGAR|nr:hypothetical protein DFH07DRAFT_970697 [Mycena maculata]
MSQSKETPVHYTTRSGTLRGHTSPVKESESVSDRSSSPAGSLAGTLRMDRESVALPKSRTVTPELSYSQVVAADLTPARELSTMTSNSATPSESLEPSRLASLNPEVDFDVPGPDEGAGWTEVTRKTARSHREQATSNAGHVSGRAEPVNNSIKSLSPVSRTTQDLSNEQLIQIARRYQSLANEALAAVGRGPVSESTEVINSGPTVPSNTVHQGSPVMMTPIIITNSPDAPSKLRPVSPIVRSGEGASGNKGKGVHPGNWGNTNISEQFSEEDFEAQRVAFANYEEINCVIKSDGELTPDDLIFHPLILLSHLEERLHRLSRTWHLEREVAEQCLARPLPKGSPV